MNKKCFLSHEAKMYISANDMHVYMFHYTVWNNYHIHSKYILYFVA